jgi:hypothetical protein
MGDIPETPNNEFWRRYKPNRQTFNGAPVLYGVVINGDGSTGWGGVSASQQPRTDRTKIGAYRPDLGDR